MGRQIKGSCIALLILLGSTGWVWAGEVTGLKTFSAGTPAKASEVNDNFSAVKTAVDDNNAVTTSNYADITKNASDINTLKSEQPGVAWTQGDSGGTIGSTSAALKSLVLVAPSSGFAIVTATGSVLWNIASSAAAGSVRLKISDTSGDTKAGGNVQFIQFQGVPKTGAYYFPFSTTRVLNVVKGNNTFYLNGVHQTVNGTASVDDYTLTAMFVPNRYNSKVIIIDPGLIDRPIIPNP